MILKDALINIQYDSGWAIYAEIVDGKFSEHSEARYGQTVFENGGLLDDKVYVCHGEQIGDWLTSYGFAPDKSDIDDDPYWIDAFLEEANEWIDKVDEWVRTAYD